MCLYNLTLDLRICAVSTRRDLICRCACAALLQPPHGAPATPQRILHRSTAAMCVHADVNQRRFVPIQPCSVSEARAPLGPCARLAASGGPRSAHLRPRSGAAVARSASVALSRPQQRRSSAADSAHPDGCQDDHHLRAGPARGHGRLHRRPQRRARRRCGVAARGRGAPLTTMPPGWRFGALMPALRRRDSRHRDWRRRGHDGGVAADAVVVARQVAGRAHVHRRDGRQGPEAAAQPQERRPARLLPRRGAVLRLRRVRAHRQHRL